MIDPIGKTTITDLPSSLVFNSILPLSPSMSTWKMTAAFSMGLESEARTTETSTFAVGGGGLYLRPRRVFSCAERLTAAMTSRAILTVKMRRKRGDNMPALYPLRRPAGEWQIGRRRTLNPADDPQFPTRGRSPQVQ